MNKQITLKEVKEISFVLAQKLHTFNQPFPGFESRFPNRLESCLATPYQTIDKKDCYPTTIHKLSVMFYLMNKNHSFQNGNKRVAITTLLYALYKEGKWLTVDYMTLYETSIFVSNSLPKAKDQMIDYIQKFISSNLTPYKKDSED